MFPFLPYLLLEGGMLIAGLRRLQINFVTPHYNKTFWGKVTLQSFYIATLSVIDAVLCSVCNPIDTVHFVCNLEMEDNMIFCRQPKMRNSSVREVSK